MASNVSNVYVHVIDDVISKVRHEFATYGSGEAVLNELQALWEMKMMQCGAINGPIERSSIPKPTGPNPVFDLNVPYEGPAEELRCKPPYKLPYLEQWIRECIIFQLAPRIMLLLQFLKSETVLT